MSGLELIREVRKFDEHVQVVVITAAATLETAISAMRADGAYDYLLKPLEVIGELSVAVERAAAHRRLRLEREELQAKLAMEANRLQTLIAHTGDDIIAAEQRGDQRDVRAKGRHCPETRAHDAILQTLWWIRCGGSATASLPHQRARARAGAARVAGSRADEA